jgi:large subunit ribosomal protein L18
MDKNIARLRRAKSTRAHIRKLEVVRLSVHRSNQHLYAQVFSASGDRVIAAASTLQESISAGLKGTKNIAAAAAVGKAVAERCRQGFGRCRARGGAQVLVASNTTPSGLVP